MKKMYNILSPDGITIRLEDFGTKKINHENKPNPSHSIK